MGIEKLDPFIVRGRYVAVEQHLSDSVSKGGIVLTEQKTLPQGSVVAFGDDVEDLVVGDVVCFTEFAGATLSVSGQPYRILPEEDILLILARDFSEKE